MKKTFNKAQYTTSHSKWNENTRTFLIEKVINTNDT